jgi:hypothetical protein
MSAFLTRINDHKWKPLWSMTTVTHYCLGKPIFGGKPTLWIRRLGFRGHNPNNIKLKTAEKADKVMSLNIEF